MTNSFKDLLDEMRASLARNYELLKLLETLGGASFDSASVSATKLDTQRNLVAADGARKEEVNSELRREDSNQDGAAIHLEAADTLPEHLSGDSIAYGSDRRPLVNWVIGPADNLQWAYGNNASRLIKHMPHFRHAISSSGRSNVAVYFDVIVADRYPVDSDVSIVRLGGPRPLKRQFGDDMEKLKDGLSRFDGVIALNLSLYRQALEVHNNVILCPNALDLEHWTPLWKPPSKDKRFVLGFAASAKSKDEENVKGVALAKEAARTADVDLMIASKGGDAQIPHDQVISSFYAKCDALIHPVGPGREGSSNVIMEALALGVPVITTPHAGFHGETLTDRQNALIRSRDVGELEEAIRTLRSDRKLAKRLSEAGRDFVLRHHDIRNAASQYWTMIDRTLSAKKKGRSAYNSKGTDVCFVPFWMPASDFASSRLRAEYPVAILSKERWLNVSLGYNEKARVAFIVQSCDDTTLAAINKNTRQRVVYDVCDRYYESEKIFKLPTGVVNSRLRFFEIAQRADVLTVPSIEMKIALSTLFPHKPVFYIPESIDYSQMPEVAQATSRRPKTVLWFGNPDRGNFESVAEILAVLQERHGYEPIIISRPGYFAKYPQFRPFVRKWSMDAMKVALAEASLCVVGHSDEEHTKSANRLVTAVAHGVPTIATPSPSYIPFFMRARAEFAIIRSPNKVFDSVKRLTTGTTGRNAQMRLERAVRREHSEQRVRRAYTSLIKATRHERNDPKLNIAVVTHNLSIGEGAPRSLLELASGLSEQCGFNLFAYSSCGGPLSKSYEAAGIPLHVFDENASHAAKVLNKQAGSVKRDFANFIQSNEIDYVFCNTVKSAPFVAFCESTGVPCTLIVRESFVKGERLSAFQSEARAYAESGLPAARDVVFVSGESMRFWKDYTFRGETHLIPNGIDISRFSEAQSRSKQETRELLGLAEDSFVAVCVGTINERKGQAQLFEWFSRLPKDIQHTMQLVFVGATFGRYLDDLKAAVAATPVELASRIRIVEATKDVGVWYRAADLALLNSRSEAYPRTIMEAFSFGLPVLSTKVFGTQEQVENGMSGVLYDIDEESAWAKSIIEIVQSTDKLAFMSYAARRQFGALTSFSEMIWLYAGLVRAAVRRRQPAHS